MSWPTELLQNVATFTLGKMLDAQKNRGELRPYLANVNVRWGAFELNDLREMRFQDSELDRFGLKHGDIVMCEGGEPGRCAIWKDQPPAMMVQKALHRIRAGERMDYRFLFYVFLHQGRTGAFAGLFTGATIKHLPKDKLAQIRVPVPPLQTQRRIADILSAYDDLIENNTRRIAILEDLARRLFEEWFLADAKAGRWVDLENLCEGKTGIQTGPFGSQLHKQDYSDDGVPVVMPKNMADLKIREEGIARIPTELAATMPRHILRDGDIVYGRRGDIGRRAFVTHREDGWFCGTGCLRIRPDKGKISPRYLFDALGLPETDGAIKGRAHGATMPNLSAGLMKSVPVFLPEKDVQERYAVLVDPLFELAASLETCTINLRTTRDLLLPKLISGEIEVRAADEALEAAAA